MTEPAPGRVSESERSATNTKVMGSVVFVLASGAAIIAAGIGHWYLFGGSAFIAVIGLGFRIEGAIREDIARLARNRAERSNDPLV